MKLKHLIPMVAVMLLTGCSVLNDDVRIKGGSLKTDSISLKQGQDAKAPSTFTQENQSILIPAGSSVVIGTNTIILSSNAVYSVSKISTELGSSQKNVLGIYAEKLKALSWITWLGALLVIFGAASAVYPPLKLIINSLTTSAVIVAVGIGFIALPTLLVGHETLILCIGLGAAGLYWFAHRHGSIAAELHTLKTSLGGTNEETDKTP